MMRMLGGRLSLLGRDKGGMGVCAGGTAGLRRLVGALAVMVLVGSIPDKAAAYALIAKGRLARVDVLVVWEAERQVLALMPHLIGAEEGGFFIVPVPKGAEVVSPPDPEMFTPSRSQADEDEESAGGKEPSRGQDVRGEAELSEGESTGAKAQGKSSGSQSRARMLPARELRTPLTARRFRLVTGDGPELLRPEREPIIIEDDVVEEALSALLGPDLYATVSGEAAVAYIDQEWTFAVMEIPPHEGPVRFGPLAFSMQTPRPTVPVRLAEGSGSHGVSIRLISPEQPTEPGAMRFAFGLRNTQRPMHVDDAVGAWMKAVGFEAVAGWRSRGLAAGPIDSRRYPLGEIEWDLIVPAPSRSVSATVEEEDRHVKSDVGEAPAGCGCGCSIGGMGDREAGTRNPALLFLVAGSVLALRRFVGYRRACLPGTAVGMRPED